MHPLIHPVLLCGGSGTRLWPLSRKSYPKQFVKFLGGESLYQLTARRLSGTGYADPMVVTNSDYRFICLEQLSSLEILPQTILIEPSARNTAAAICAAAVSLDSQFGDSMMLVAPSDHVIPDAAKFRDTIEAAISQAHMGQIVTFGILPKSAETGYGWLELTNKLSKDFSTVPQPLKSFVEKPDSKYAEALLKGGMHLWNAGIFLSSSQTILDTFAEHAPEILANVRKAFDRAETDLAFLRLAAEPWSCIKNISIDYAVMERAQNLCVVPYGGYWSDLGDWNAVLREGVADENGVVKIGCSTAFNCHDTLLYSSNEAQELVAIGLQDIIAVAMQDAVLVAHRDSAQNIKDVVSELNLKGVTQAETLPRDYRPWGWYESIALGPTFQVKRIVVKSGAALSLQSHNHRSEHWVVVEGIAKVTIGDEVKIVRENQSAYIPLQEIHRLENPGDEPLTLIEIQTGSYFGEDDIIRYEDVYARGKVAKR
jgi:mannose-1-phosphate guanylyltransferase / mannose-6-phosphate isomerase